ncbi:unnamed protein product [Sphagnum jensenii]
MAKIDKSTMDTYVNGKLVKEGKKDEIMANRFTWWKADKKNMGRQILATIKFMVDHQGTKLEQITASTRLYGNSSAFNFVGPALSRSASSSPSSNSNRVTFNLCASVVDTIVSKISKNKVIPTFLTSGGVWSMQKKAEDLSKFLEGCFYHNDIQTVKDYMTRDACVWSTGVVHVFDDEDEIGVERVLPHEIIIDQIETMNAYPKQLHRTKIIDRDILLGQFRDDEEATSIIQMANPSSYLDIGSIGTACDLLQVTESWHLPSYEDADDGIHVITLGDEVLFEEPYEKDYFPFVFLNYSKGLVGFFGEGACERLMNLQAEINRSMILEQRSRWMQGSFKVLIENGSKVVSQHLNNEVGTIIHYSGTPPQYVVPPAIDQSNREWIDSLIAKGFQQEGVSQLAATSLKPSGVDSGAAMRTYDEIGDDRLMFFSQQVERAVLEIGRQMIEVAKNIYSRKKKFVVTFPQGTFIESIDWADIKLDEDEYVLKAYPISTLPDDPAGRLAYVQEQMQAGLISPRAGRKLMQMPDIEMSDKIANASQNLIDNIVEKMLDEDGEYSPPEPFYDLDACKTTALQYYNYAKLHNCPEDKLENLRKFMNQVDDLNGVSQQALQVQQMMAQAQAQPQANPTPTPQSNLIPNTAGAVQ